MPASSASQLCSSTAPSFPRMSRPWAGWRQKWDSNRCVVWFGGDGDGEGSSPASPPAPLLLGDPYTDWLYTSPGIKSGFKKIKRGAPAQLFALTAPSLCPGLTPALSHILRPNTCRSRSPPPLLHAPTRPPPLQISLSSSVMPMVKMVPRGFTAAADAYLTPHIMRYAYLRPFGSATPPTHQNYAGS